MKTIDNVAVWFEIPVTNLERAKKFYETVLDISMHDLDIGEDLKMALFPNTEGTIGGSLCERHEFYTPSQQGALIYLNASPDLEEALQRVETAGGKILLKKRQISPEYGYMALIIDSEGNRIALHSMT
ncbi:MAG: VOC family protein [Gammaproteobacteria bacterium]|nr:VOC family protein [Gammaproteobacteria bacterium]